MIEVEVDSTEILSSLRNLIALGRDAGTVMADIARLGERITRRHFDTGIGPDGRKWKPSLRARITGGLTLVQAGHLVDSTSSRHGRDYAEWGVNSIYARIHQFGGEIRAKGGSLRSAWSTAVSPRSRRSPCRPGRSSVFPTTTATTSSTSSRRGLRDRGSQNTIENK